MKNIFITACLSVLLLSGCVKAERPPYSLNTQQGLLGFLALGFYSIAQFVAAGDNGTVLYSFDGKNWKTSSYPYTSPSQMMSVSSNGRIWVGVGMDNSSSCGVWSSDDGVKWTRRNCPATATVMNTVTSGKSGKFLAAGTCNSGIMSMMSSADGINWNDAGSYVCSSETANSLTYDPIYGIYFMSLIGAVGNSYLISTDGTNWNAAASPTNSPAIFSDASQSTLIGIDNTQRTMEEYYFSSDTWTSSLLYNPGAAIYTSADFAFWSGVYVAVGSDNASCLLTYNNSGSWVSAANYPPSCLGNYLVQNVTYNSLLNIFVASGNIANSLQFIYTNEGNTWADGSNHALTNPVIKDISSIY